MTGLFGTLNTSTSGMRAQQIALQTTGHNLANTNTKGYSRQRVTMQTSVPQSFAGIGQMGTGVQIGGVTRVTDDYITRQLNNELSSLEQQENISEVLGQLEVLFNEPSNTGMAHQMSEVFVAWGNVAANPDKIASKKAVIRQSETFIDTVNHLSNQIDKLANDTVRQVEQDVRDFNSTAEQLKKVNDQIFNAKIKGEEPNDLLDSQDRLVGELQRISGADIDSTTDKYGRVFVSLNDENGNKIDIVTEGKVEELEFKKKDSDDINVGAKPYELKVGDNVVELDKGSIKGFEKAYEKVRETEKELDKLVLNFAEAVNTVMTGGTHRNENLGGTANPDKGKLFFIFPTDKGRPSAKSITVNAELIDNPESLIVGKNFGTPSNPSDKIIAGDGSRAKAISDLKNTSLDFHNIKEGTASQGTILEMNNWEYNENSMSFPNNPEGSTFDNYYNNIVTDMGIEKQQADNMVANQSDLVSLLEQRQESMSGVDLNEEVVDMIRFQSAFQANARVISTINDMLDTLINRMGV